VVKCKLRGKGLRLGGQMTTPYVACAADA
jgi:hypothetical protein